MSFTGTGALLRFTFRRERFALPWWLLGAALLLLVQSTQSQKLYDTPQDLEALRRTLGGNTAVVAMSGPTELLATVGGEVVFEIFSYLAIVVALMNMFLVGRHTRAEEESGRAEVVRSGPVGRHAPVAAALVMAALANAAAALLVFAVAAGTGLPAGGSVLLGLAVAGVGLTFAGLTAVAAQVFENTRAMYGSVALALGAAYALRAAGDVGDGTLSWLSPIGWGQRTLPFAAQRWWPLLLPLAFTALLLVAAVALLDRRDFGAGLLRSRPGRPAASRALTSPVGLAWRLQRGALIGWAAGLGLLGVAFGSIGNSIQEYIEDNPEVADFLPGGAQQIVDAYLALTIMLSALITAAYGVTSALRARGEETAGRAEPVLATATGRGAWLGGHLSVALAGSALVLLTIGFGEGLAYALTVDDPGQIPRLMAVALVYVPAVWLVIAVAVLGVGLLPRLAALVSWVVVGYCGVVGLFADSFDLPGWLRSASPFDHTPQAPLEGVSAVPLLVIGALVIAFMVAGFAGLRRRDVGF